MKTYTVHFPKGTAGITADVLTGAVLIRDGFSWGAFLFGPFWLLWHRLWLAGFAVLAAEIALAVFFQALQIGPPFSGVANLAVMVLLGLEGYSLKRWTYQRRGLAIASVVSGQDETEAEAKMIAAGLHRMAHPPHNANPPPARTVFPTAGTPPEAFGMFPLLEQPK